MNAISDPTREPDHSSRLWSRELKSEPYCTVPFQHRGNRQPRLGGLQRPSARHLRANSVTVPIALALLQATQQRIKNVDVNIMR